MASGWNLWVWLECIGVVGGCFCKEVYSFHITLLIPTPLVLALILQQCPYFFVHFFNCFPILYCLRVTAFFVFGLVLYCS